MTIRIDRSWISLLALSLFASVPLACSTRVDDSSGVAPSSEELAFQKLEKLQYKPLCNSAKAKPGHAHCHAGIAVDAQGKALGTSSPQSGTLAPADIQSAYAIPNGGGQGKIVALIDAQDDPTAENDLGVYRQQYGLPPCTTANGCFTKVNQRGDSSSFPAVDPGWAGEISLDVDMVSAACPECKILLVEADSQSLNDLGAAVNTAVSLGATTISNSYGAAEESWDASPSAANTQFFQHPGVGIFASAGDQGYNHPNNDPFDTHTGASFPASATQVIGVGGTTLVQSSTSRGWSERVWNQGGSGCSHTLAKPSWQNDTGCSNKTVADLAAVALNLSVYNTTVDSSRGETPGWQNFGGTSASSPLVAAIYAKTGHGADTGQQVWADASVFFDITSGSNGSCGGSYLCTAKTGYDAPTGWGTPNAAKLAGNLPPPPTGCAHDKCATGGSLVSSCDTCVSQICNQDSFCCATAWDSQCVSEVGSICGLTCN